VLVDYIRVCEIPNRCPDIKVGDREETRFADISPCMLWEKRQEGEGEGEEHGDDVEAGRSCQRSANLLAFPLFRPRSLPFQIPNFFALSSLHQFLDACMEN
jgi:hypothetical protein